MLMVMIASVPGPGVERFAAYETAVLQLLGRHGGTLERRLRHVTADGGWKELHVVRFEAAEGFVAYRADPARAEHAALLEGCGAVFEVLTVEDVG
ncbi:MAG: hypothetical protein IT370_14680 [Deltaproteobacteria bacterium]|nr:hypothetical protein [Deltaproteobacteria bacterium]